ncbi:MAG: FGLLP motif-containing membrane protein, partial [Acidimicrobiia bacterium]
RYRQWGRLAVLPGSAVVAAACVGFSRLLHFLPGYLFGLIAGFTFRHEEDERTKGRLTAAGCLFILLVAIAAWIARGPVSTAAAGPGAGPGLFALEALLTAVFLLGLESLLFGLLPLRFLNGSKVVAWSRTAWAALFGLALFGSVHVLLAPGSGYVGSTSKRTTIGVVLLYVGFGLGSFAFWAYFRYRPQSWIPASARGPEGDFEDIERI